MGALTSKPTAFSFRTWELNSMLYTSCQDSLVPSCRIDLYQKKIVRVLPVEDWIGDNIRFLFVNLDKQTLKSPAMLFLQKSNFLLLKVKKVLKQQSLQQVYNILNYRLKKKTKKVLNLLMGSLFSNSMNLYYRFKSHNVKLNFFYKNSFLDKLVDIEKFPKVLLLNVNPRLDSPLFDLSLREREKKIDSVGNYSYNTITNNLIILTNLVLTTLVVYSESLKGNNLILGLKNTKVNLSPAYLNLPLKNFSLKTQEKDSINFLLALPENLKLNLFTVLFSTTLRSLNFDIYIPITNYFVSKGELLSIKGIKKLKMVRPSFTLQDYIRGLTLHYNDSTSKLYEIKSMKKMFIIKNRLAYFNRRKLPLDG